MVHCNGVPRPKVARSGAAVSNGGPGGPKKAEFPTPKRQGPRWSKSGGGGYPKRWGARWSQSVRGPDPKTNWSPMIPKREASRAKAGWGGRGCLAQSIGGCHPNVVELRWSQSGGGPRPNAVGASVVTKRWRPPPQALGGLVVSRRRRLLDQNGGGPSGPQRGRGPRTNAALAQVVTKLRRRSAKRRRRPLWSNATEAPAPTRCSSSAGSGCTSGAKKAKLPAPKQKGSRRSKSGGGPCLGGPVVPKRRRPQRQHQRGAHGPKAAKLPAPKHAGSCLSQSVGGPHQKAMELRWY